MINNFQPYVRPKPPKAGADASILSRFPKVIYGFIEGAAKIREASLREPGNVNLREPSNVKFHPYWERIIASGLAWGRELLFAPVAISIKNEVPEFSIQLVYGNISKREQATALRRVRNICESTPISDQGPVIWYNNQDLVLSCAVYRQARPQYFYFVNVPNLTPSDVRLAN